MRSAIKVLKLSPAAAKPSVSSSGQQQDQRGAEDGPVNAADTADDHHGERLNADENAESVHATPEGARRQRRAQGIRVTNVFKERACLKRGLFI